MTDAEFIAVCDLPARHGFFTRRGGVSMGPYASLNCALAGQDSREAILENRARAARALGADPAHLVGLTQVHGIEVTRVEAPWLPGHGPRADAAVTDRPGVAIGIVTADCAPVLFADPVARVVGGAHAGWRGALAGVLEATLASMETLGARRERIVAAVGPCIGVASYEVAADLREAVLAHDEAAWLEVWVRLCAVRWLEHAPPVYAAPVHIPLCSCGSLEACGEDQIPCVAIGAHCQVPSCRPSWPVGDCHRRHPTAGSGISHHLRCSAQDLEDPRPVRPQYRASVASRPWHLWDCVLLLAVQPASRRFLSASRDAPAQWARCTCGRTSERWRHTAHCYIAQALCAQTILHSLAADGCRARVG